jgi:protein-S-isoprenylcysteine O-methyltransferase Ste14
MGRVWPPRGGDVVHVLDHAHEQLRRTGRKNTKDRGQAVITTGPYAIVRHPMYFGALFYIAGTSLVLGSWWGLVTVPILALLLGIRIGIEERALRIGLNGSDDYARRVRWRLLPFIW